MYSASSKENTSVVRARTTVGSVPEGWPEGRSPATGGVKVAEMGVPLRTGVTEADGDGRIDVAPGARLVAAGSVEAMILGTGDALSPNEDIELGVGRTETSSEERLPGAGTTAMLLDEGKDAVAAAEVAIAEILPGGKLDVGTTKRELLNVAPEVGASKTTEPDPLVKANELNEPTTKDPVAATEVDVNPVSSLPTDEVPTKVDDTGTTTKSELRPGT